MKKFLKKPKTTDSFSDSDQKTDLKKASKSSWGEDDESDFSKQISNNKSVESKIRKQPVKKLTAPQPQPEMSEKDSEFDETSKGGTSKRVKEANMHNNSTIPEALDEELHTMQPVPEIIQQQKPILKSVERKVEEFYKPTEKSAHASKSLKSNTQYSFHQEDLQIEQPEEDEEAIPVVQTPEIANQRVMTAPSIPSRQMMQNSRLNGGLYKAFKESELLKAANIYSQFDKKGNLYENRLYAKTSINQARLQVDQVYYDQAMEGQPDEEARINNMSEHLEGASAVQGKSQRSFKNSITQKSHQSHSTFFGQNQLIKPSTQMGYRQTGGRNSTVRSPTNAMSMTKGTFSQAGKPRVNTAGNAFDMMSKRSLYQKIVAENIDANRS